MCYKVYWKVGDILMSLKSSIHRLICDSSIRKRDEEFLEKKKSLKSVANYIQLIVNSPKYVTANDLIGGDHIIH